MVRPKGVEPLKLQILSLLAFPICPQAHKTKTSPDFHFINGVEIYIPITGNFCTKPIMKSMALRLKFEKGIFNPMHEVISMPTFKTLICKHCSKSFLRELRQIKPNRTTFCSSECSHKSSVKSQTVCCLNCGIYFTKKYTEIIKRANHFCTQSCSATYNNTHKTKGFRRSKIEIWLEEKLTKLYDIPIIFNGKEAINSELDIYIPSLKLAFELNGIFHYEPIYGLEKLSQIQNNDSRKFQACLEQGIELCIIDTSNLKHFKEQKAEFFLELIQKIISTKLSNS
jgi:hypothetical protein